MSNTYADLKTSIFLEPLTLYTNKARLKTRLYSWLTDNQDTIAEHIRKRKLILSTATTIDFVTDISQLEFDNCSTTERSQIVSELLSESGINITSFTAVYGNVYVRIQIR